MGADEHPSDDCGFDIVMPFVVARSNGGHLDDDAFIAGFTCGQAWTALACGRPFESPVKPDLVRQLDLIAMRYDARLEVAGLQMDEHDPTGRVQVTITPPVAARR